MWIFKALAERLKALFITDVSSEFEAQMVARDAERKAALLRQAKKYEDEGLNGIAQEMRRQTESLSTQKPMATVLPAIEFFHATEPSLFAEEDKSVVALLPAPAPAPSSVTASLPTILPVTNKKKKGR